MRKTTDNVSDEFLIPQAKSNKCGKYGKSVLKCCVIVALSLGLNAFSFYVGYKFAETDNSESL